MLPAMPPSSGKRLHFTGFLVAALLALAASGCYRVPDGKRAVTSVALEGTHDIDDEDLEGRIATRESTRFLGLFEGVVFEYEIFDPFALRRDLQRIERYLRAHGFYDAHVYAARVIDTGTKVRVTIAVDEGEPVLVESISIAELHPVDDAAKHTMERRIHRLVPIDARLEEDKFAASETAARKALSGAGHAAATVKREAEVDMGRHRARLRYTVDPGPSGTFGPVTFEGLGELPEEQVRRIFGAEQGKLYSSDVIDEGRQALLELGLFASLDVTQDLGEFERSQTVPIHVKAELSKLRSVIVGAGIELDSLKTDGHLQLGWQNGNFLGGLRKLDLRYKPGIVLYPTRFPSLPPPTHYLYEHRITATLRQPAFIEKRTTGFSRAEYNIYPALVPGADPTTDVLGYHELRGALGVERTVFDKLDVTPAYNVQANFPFDYVGHTADVETLVVSYAELDTHLDLRNDPVKTRRGIYLGNDLQLAGGALQGAAKDIRIQPEIRGYIPLPRKVTIALRSSVGFLFPFNYAKNLASESVESARDYQLLFFRGFFSGGPTSNRGYPLRGVGPHKILPFLSPAGQSATAVSRCQAQQNSAPICDLPTGGLSLWEANAEVRWVVSGPFSTAVFCDASDVSPNPLEIRLDRPHLSCGAGARYDTLVGPIRLDVGYRIPGLQYPSGVTSESDPGGWPIAIAFGIGEAF